MKNKIKLSELRKIIREELINTLIQKKTIAESSAPETPKN